MADIFLSYAREDRERIKVLVVELERHGWSVWWDRRILPGKSFDQVIEQSLDAAKCVVVVWSKHSVQSDWVINEAEEGGRRRILVPVIIDDVRVPLGFRRMQASQLVGWEGQSSHAELEPLFESIKEIIGGVPGTASIDKTDSVERAERKEEKQPEVAEPARAVTKVASSRPPIWMGIVAGIGALAVLILILSIIRQSNQSPGLPPNVTLIGSEGIFFNNWNQGEVEQVPPTQSTFFTLDTPHYITGVATYHWNAGVGKDPPKLGMQIISRMDGKPFGTWPMQPNSDGNDKGNWICNPNVFLPAGTYALMDPDPASWSQNNQSEHRGMAWVRGFKAEVRK